MKKPLSLFAVVALSSCLALSGCGKSVQDARAEAYTQVQSMQGLSESQVEEYESQLDVAADAAAIDNIVAKAKSHSDELLAEKVSASASAVATKAAEGELRSALSGVSLVGTSPECKGKALTFNEDGSWGGEAGTDPTCLKFLGVNKIGGDNGYWWVVSKENGTSLAVTDVPEGKAVVFSVRANYRVTVEGDTYTFVAIPWEESQFAASTPAPVGVEGSHTFVLSSGS